MTKRILISGCSFSETQSHNTHSVWKPWTDLLEDFYDYDVTNVAISSAGQGEISERLVSSVINSVNKYDLVIVQWSAIGRGYATNEVDWMERVISTNNLQMFRNSNEYLNTGLEEHRTSDQFNEVFDEQYISSLGKIKLVQSFLENQNIPYLFFWGWQQLNDNIYKKHTKLIDSIYTANWWYPNHRFEGMLQYILKEIGESKGISSDGLHPSSEGHDLFFENIIKNEIQRYLK